MSARTGAEVFLSVTLAGAQEPERLDLSTRFLGISYDDDEKKPDKLMLRVDNFDLTEFEQDTWRKGNVIHVSWGYHGEMSPERECVIQTVKGSTELSIEANGKEAVMNRKKKGRTFLNTTRSGAVKKILKEYNITFAEANIDDTEVVFEQISQAAVTCYEFIRDLARRERFEFFIDFDGGHFHKRRTGQKPQREFVYYIDPNQGDIITWNIDNDISAGKPGAVNLQGRDPDTKEDVDAKADNTTVTRDGPGAVLESIGEDDGAAHDVALVASEHVAPTTEAQPAAERKAAGLYTQSQLAAVKLTMTCWGDPNVLAKSIISIGGLGPLFSGNYYVNSVKHDVGSGYTMVIKCSRDGHGKSGGMAGDTKTKAKLNDADPPANADGLTPVEKVDEEDGTATQTFQDTRGRGTQ